MKTTNCIPDSDGQTIGYARNPAPLARWQVTVHKEDSECVFHFHLRDHAERFAESNRKLGHLVKVDEIP